MKCGLILIYCLRKKKYYYYLKILLREREVSYGEKEKYLNQLLKVEEENQVQDIYFNINKLHTIFPHVIFLNLFYHLLAYLVKYYNTSLKK